MAEHYRTFREFYPFYLTEHVNPVSRRLHVVGASLVLVSVVAGVRHFFFEKNAPATFKYLTFSLMGDFRLWFEGVTLQREF